MAEEPELKQIDQVDANLDDQDMLRAVLHSVRGISPISTPNQLAVDLDAIEE
jgi:hypothetical protein